MSGDILNVRIPPDQTAPEEWERWFHIEGFRLMECEIPEPILKDKFLWRDFFANGRMEYSGYSDFTVHRISTENLVKLKSVLDESFPREVLGEVDLYIVLCSRLGINVVPE